MKKRIMLFMIAILLPVSMYSAPFYDTGSQMFSFNVGTTIPAFEYFFSDGEFLTGLGEGNTGMNAGGYGAISYQVFTTPRFAIGGEIGYNFNYTAEDELFTAVPFFAKITYFPVQGVVDIPVSLGLGAAFIKYGDGSLMTLYANIGLGITWYPIDHWGFGLTSGIWIIPELNYTEAITGDDAIAGFVPITLSVTYRQ
ncbi:TP0733 family outer membrane beta-barrel protein [uncultured Sphaerochaeta sp.]|uniref:TP0733 family outer membrane beta-barrel protein n=1 Tax=uncultured Sphaerochaeta sp. TaxID=886478 RepID=UPI002A0A110F|nr:hypothetical protein [uncultured Sphaerochaeta sp.]